MTKPYFCLLPVALLFLFAAAGTAAEKPTFTKAGHTTDSVVMVKKQLIANKAVLLDVREESEWKNGHLKDAQLLPLSIIREGRLTADQKKLLPKDKPVYCHCASGGRVLTVSKILRAKGYDIRPLKAGFVDLVKNGFKEAE
jgi:phage shock protein E